MNTDQSLLTEQPQFGKMLVFAKGHGTCIYIKTSHKIIFLTFYFLPEFSNLNETYIPKRQLVPFFFLKEKNLFGKQDCLL